MISLPGALYLGMYSVEGYLVIFVLNALSGRVHHLSRKITVGWSSKISVRRNLQMRKTIRACSGLKIKMGSVNFVDRLTPFVVCGFCLKLTVRFLMASKK
jgi:hypothetical protein